MTALYHAYTQTVADGTATSVVRPSDWNSAHVQGQTVSGNTAGVSSFTGTNIVLQGGNNVTLSAATAAGAATIVISGANTVAQTVQTQASGGIAGTGFTSTTTAGTNVTAAMGSNGLSMAVPAYITTYANDLTSGRAGTGFTSTTTAGTNITAALGTNGLSMAVPAYITTYAAQTTQTQASGNIAGTGYTSTTQAGSTVGVTHNTAGLSVAWPPYITTVTQSVQTQASGAIAGTGFTSTTTAGTAVTAALGTNGLSMAVPAYITTYVNDLTSGRAGTGFTSTTTAGTAITAALGTNGLSMAVPAFITTYVNDLTSGRAGTGFTSTTTAGTAITAALGTNGLSMAVPAYITTYVNDLTSGRAGTGFTSTTTAGTAITAALGTDGLSMAVPAFITTYVNDLTSGRAGTGTTLALTNLTGTLGVGTDGVALSLSAGAGGGTTNQTGPNIAVAGSTITSGTVLFSNANSVTFGMAGSTITASVGGFTASGYNHYNDVVQVAGQVGQGTVNFDPVNLDFPVQFDRFGFPIAYTATSNSTGSQTITLRIGIYTNNASTLSLLQSTSTTVTAANSGTAGSYSIFSGVRLITVPFTTTLQPNDYWMGVLSSTSSSSQNGASISAMLQSNLGSNFVGFFGQSNNTTQQYTLGQGVYTVTTNAMPVSVAFSQIRGSDSNAARPPIVGWYSGTV